VEQTADAFIRLAKEKVVEQGREPTKEAIIGAVKEIGVELKDEEKSPQLVGELVKAIAELS
jgi:hypothetical protein